MAEISGEDQRRYIEGHASAEPVNIYDPDLAASGQYFMNKYGTGRHEVRQQEAPDIGAQTTAGSAVVYEGREILAGEMDFGGPEGARRWDAALLSAAEVAESARGFADRRCRVCGCTDSAACDTISGPCAWRIIYEDNTGICTACQVPGSPE